MTGPPLNAQIGRYLNARAGVLCDVPGFPSRIRLKKRGSIYLASVIFADRSEHQLVIKPMSRDAQVSGPAELMRIQRNLRSRDRDLAGQLVDILDSHAEPSWIVMPVVAGETLEALLHRSLKSRVPAKQCVAEAAVKKLAGALAALHEIPARQLGLRPGCQRNAQYLPVMRQLWAKHPLAVRALTPGITVAQILERVIGGDFADRCADRLVPVDVQPKNQMVDAAGRLTLIDPDYTVGHPAITLATFLVGLDRLALRHPSRRSARRIERLKRIFVRAYARHGRAWVITDLAGFYPWALLRVYDEHAQARPWARPYLAHVYGSAMRRFVRSVVKTGRPWSRLKQSPANLVHAA